MQLQVALRQSAAEDGQSTDVRYRGVERRFWQFSELFVLGFIYIQIDLQTHKWGEGPISFLLRPRVNFLQQMFHFFPFLNMFLEIDLIFDLLLHPFMTVYSHVKTILTKHDFPLFILLCTAIDKDCTQYHSKFMFNSHGNVHNLNISLH